MTAIVDYGVGNLFSLRSSFHMIGEDITVTGDASSLRRADKIILPGVGAFGDAVSKLRERNLDEALIDASREGKPMMGICLGMQLLFEQSFEYGVHAGLGLLRGEVAAMRGVLPCDLKIPHIGWNALIFHRDSYLTKYIQNGDHVYFVHSYYARNCEKSLVASASYGIDVPAIVQRDNVCGCQFHPEKSGKAGLAILKAFCEGKGSI